jgi:sugar lactone lactonase YvrE
MEASVMKALPFGKGLAMGESPRWWRGQLWVCDWGAREIVVWSKGGDRVATYPVPFDLPFCIDASPDGSLFVVDGRGAQVLRMDSAGALTSFADLRHISAGPWNEIVVDPQGNAYVNAPEAIALITPDGDPRRVAEGGQFPNGMALTPDGCTLLLAESHGQCITAFDRLPDGSLARRRVWARLEGPPDGICLDAEGAVWYADVLNQRCQRVAEGGLVLAAVDLDLGCFSCTFGGDDGGTLFIVANEWQGMDRIAEVAEARTGGILTLVAPSPGALKSDAPGPAGNSSDD